MNMPFQDKNYVIAGGSKGIGLALTHRILDGGGKAFVYSRSRGELPSSDQIHHQTCDFANNEFDTTSLPDVIHGAVYCPGTINLRSFRSLKLADFQNDFEVNFLGAVAFLKGCLGGLKKGSSDHPASVLLFSTVAARSGMPMHSSIASIKGAIEGLTVSLAAEWAPAIRVNCLAPALTDTPLAEKFFATPEKRTAMDAKYPMGRSGRPEDLAATAAFLLGDESGWITGQVIGVDGGMSSIRG